MEELGRRVAAASPDALVVATPHSVHVEGHFAVAVAARVGEHEVDRELAAAILGALRGAGIPALGVSYGGNDPAEAELPLDSGTEVPLRFLPRSLWQLLLLHGAVGGHGPAELLAYERPTYYGMLVAVYEL
jgi:aromatic ring-opening dioxygenase LigB subunit